MAARKRIRRKLRRKPPAVRQPGLAPPVKGGEGSDLMVGGAMDPAERAADRMASRALSGQANIDGSAPSAGGGALHRQAVAPVVAPGADSAPAPKAARDAVGSMGAGRPLGRAERAFFEPRFGQDFGQVRLHDDPGAARATRALGARAFANGADIAFAPGQRTQATMAHELAHVVQDHTSTRRKPALRRDHAVLPANPGADPPALSEDERAAALSYNSRRFEDPFTVRIIRDVIGIAATPAVIDEALTDGVLRWQAEHRIAADGKLGPGTTRTIVRELRGESQARLARLVRSDNFVRVRNVAGPAFFFPFGSHPTVPSVGFEWTVSFSTSLRGGFIIQHVENQWTESGAPAGSRVPTLPGYWEAWTVTNAGAITPANRDLWRRPARRGTRGTWQMRATLFTVLNLPALFSASGAAGHVPDSGILPSTATNPGADRLGLPEGFRAIEAGDEGARVARGAWDYTGPAARQFNRSR